MISDIELIRTYLHAIVCVHFAAACVWSVEPTEAEIRMHITTYTDSAFLSSYIRTYMQLYVVHLGHHSVYLSELSPTPLCVLNACTKQLTHAL